MLKVEKFEEYIRKFDNFNKINEGKIERFGQTDPPPIC